MVLKYQNKYEQQFKSYIEKHPESMFFQSNSYIKLISELLEAEEEHLIYLEEGIIKGVFLLLSKKGCFGKVYNSLPYYGSNGCSLADSFEIENQLIKAYNELIIKDDVAASNCIENPLIQRSLNELIKHNETDYRIGQFTRIAFNDNIEKSLMDSFHYKTRNMVRKAMKSDLQVDIDNDSFNFLIETHEENMTAIGGKAKPRFFFDLVKKYFIPNKDYNIWVAYQNNKLIAALLLFYFRDTVEYYSPVIVEEYRDKQPLSYLIYISMIDASKKGFKLWNWGGTWANQGGVYTFKKRWGTYEQNYQYFIQINRKELYNIPKEILLNEYPDFFVLPFNKLKQV